MVALIELYIVILSQDRPISARALMIRLKCILLDTKPFPHASGRIDVEVVLSPPPKLPGWVCVHPNGR